MSDALVMKMEAEITTLQDRVRELEGVEAERDEQTKWLERFFPEDEEHCPGCEAPYRHGESCPSYPGGDVPETIMNKTVKPDWPFTIRYFIARHNDCHATITTLTNERDELAEQLAALESVGPPPERVQMVRLVQENKRLTNERDRLRSTLDNITDEVERELKGRDAVADYLRNERDRLREALE